MKSVFAFSALVLAAGAVLAQDSSPSLSATNSDSASSSAALSTTNSASASPTSSASATGSVKGSASQSSATASVAVATAQNATASAAGVIIATGTTSANPVPTGISANCTSFLNTLDTDKTFASCTAPLLNATSLFAPTANTASLSTSALVSTLDTLCATTGCTDSYIRSQLADFYVSCKAELSGAGASVSLKDTYDILYIMQPLTKAICSKDAGTYCVLKTPSNSTTASSATSTTSAAGNGTANFAVSSGPTSDADIVAAAVDTFYKKGTVTSRGLERRGQTVVQYAPNTETYHDEGVMYLYTLPNLSASALCTNCTQAVLTAYATWETKTPYGPGLANSPMLNAQAALWQAASAKCGTNFVASVQSAAGKAATASTANAATTSSVGMGSGFVAAFAVAIGVWVAL